jgi:hypothetical protein
MERSISSRRVSRPKTSSGTREALGSFSREFDDPSRLSPEEYLNKYGLTAYFKDVMTLVLENRPNDPLEFITEYYRNCAEGSSYLHRSYRYIRLTERNKEVFMDNLYMAYKSLSRRKGSIGTTGEELTKLLSLLCNDFPPDVSAAILRRLGKRDSDVVSFEEFALATKACLMFEEFFDLSEDIFMLASEHAEPGVGDSGGGGDGEGEGEGGSTEASTPSRPTSSPSYIATPNQQHGEKYPDLVQSTATSHDVSAGNRWLQIKEVLKLDGNVLLTAADGAGGEFTGSAEASGIATSTTATVDHGDSLFNTRVNAKTFVTVLKQTLTLADDHSGGTASIDFPALKVLEQKVLASAENHPLGNISLQEFSRCVFHMTNAELSEGDKKDNKLTR